jgi:hypothetical protein
MRTLTTAADLVKAQEQDRTYNYIVRQGYYEVASSMICDRHQIILELGPYGGPLVRGCDYMDIVASRAFPIKYHMDARVTPWDIPDKKYDLVVALQFLEHMGGHQREVWKEMRRVAKDALVSLPYMWKTEDFHDGIDEAVIRGWTGEDPDKPGELVFDQSGYARIVLFYGERT